MEFTTSLFPRASDSLLKETRWFKLATNAATLAADIPVLLLCGFILSTPYCVVNGPALYLSPKNSMIFNAVCRGRAFRIASLLPLDDMDTEENTDPQSLNLDVFNRSIFLPNEGAPRSWVGCDFVERLRGT